MPRLPRLFLASAVFLASLVPAQSQVASGSPAALSSAAPLISDALDRHVNCLQGEVTVGIWPLNGADIPIPLANANQLYADILSELIAEKPDCVSFLDADGVGATLEYLNEAGGFREQGNQPRAELEANLRDVDYYLAVSISERRNEVTAIMKLVDRARGSTLAATPPLQVPEDYLTSQCGDGAIPLERAVTAAARHLVDGAPDMRRLVLEGGYYRNTDARTGFTDYLTGLLGDAMAQYAQDTFTGDQLALVDPVAQSASTVKVRGVTVTPRELEERVVSEMDASSPRLQGPDRRPSYRLSFRTWPCAGDERMKLIVALKGRNGETISWTGAVRLGGLPDGIALHPPLEVEEADLGPKLGLEFALTSSHGPNPMLSAGDPLELLFSLGGRAWVYCFYSSSDGETIQLLPNPLSRDAPDGNLYAPDTAHLMPDPFRDPFEITITDDTVGIEVVQCMATTRDVTQDLPPELRGRSLDPIPRSYAARLKEVFEALPDTQTASARLTVTVLE